MPSVAQIDGLNIPAPAFTGLLDETYGSGAAAAYSVRRLASATTVLMRVRRDTGGGTGDDDEADVAYDTNNILSLDSAISNASAGVTATTLGQFINVGEVNSIVYSNPDSLTVTASCLVTTWYDQAGSNDAEQTVQGTQPQIHDGTADTDLIEENGNPALDFDGSDDVLTADSIVTGSTHRSSFTVVNCNTTPSINDSIYIMGQSGSSQGSKFILTAETLLRVSSGNAQYTNSAQTTQSLASHVFNGTTTGDTALFINSTSKPISSHTTTTLNTASGTSIGGDIQVSGRRYTGTMQELVFYASDKTSNRTDIEDNINAEFGIY